MTQSASTQRSRMVTGLFTDKASAERAYQFLIDRGFSDNDINVLMTDVTRDRYFSRKGEGLKASAADPSLGNKAMEGAGVGGAIGSALGAIVGALAAIGTNLVLPGLGIVIAGPIAAALAGAGAGGLTGGIVGALVGSGIPEDRAKLYESGLQSGGIIIGVVPRTEAEAVELENEFRTLNGQHIYR